MRFCTQRVSHKVASNPSIERTRPASFAGRPPALMSNVKPHVRYDPNIVYHSESRAFVLAVRAICGALFGVVPGLWLVGHLGELSVGLVVMTLVASVAVFASLAAYFGDAFWHRASQAIRSIV